MSLYSMQQFSSQTITLYRDSTTQVKTVCERELSALILVEPVLLFDNPCNKVCVSQPSALELQFEICYVFKTVAKKEFPFPMTNASIKTCKFNALTL